MKTLRTFLISALSLSMLFLSTSCAVLLVEHDQGKHKGWYKNTNNPHHPNSTNPGHHKKVHKSKGKH